MKVKKLIQKLYTAIVTDNIEDQKKLYKQITKKSLQHKKTHAVK